MKIYAIHNNTGSRYYRLVPQLKKMQEAGHEVILEAHNDKNIDAHLNWADVIIFQMVFDLTRVKRAKAIGKKVIFECDDLIHIVPKTHYEYENTRGIVNRIKWWSRIIPILIRCDGFISTNKYLNIKYGILAKKRFIFPNYADLNHWLKETKENPTDRIRLLWAGSTSHTGDLQMIKPVLKKILTKYPQVQFVYIGTGGIKTEDLNAKFIYGDDMFAELPDNRESLLPMTGKLYPYTLASIGADIAIAPLEKNYFNRFKSTCKGLEYGINKIPAVYSSWFYKDLIINGYNGFLADTEEDWITALSILIEDKQKRKQTGDNAQSFILKNYNIDNYLNEWQAFVESIYAA